MRVLSLLWIQSLELQPMIRFLKNLFLTALLIGGLSAPATAQFASQATYAGVSTGTANAQILTIPNVLSKADLLGVQFTWLPGATNTGATQINVSGTGLTNLYKPSPGGPVPLTGGELITGSPGQLALAQWDGTEYVLLSNLNATTAFLVVTPQGYLTPCQISSGSPASGCPVGGLIPTGNVISVTTLYYEPDTGNEVPIWNGSQFIPFQVTETQMTLVLGSANLANGIYDVCVAIEAGAPTLVTSVAWTTPTAGAGARGTGAGTAQIDKTVGGLWTNSVSITGKNGANSYTIAAHQCTIVASIFIDGTNGQVSFTTTFGQSRKWAVSNAYNRKIIALKAGDSTASWASSGSIFRPANGNSANSLTSFDGFAEEKINATAQMQASFTIGSGGTQHTQSGIGFNSTTAASGISGSQQISVVAAFNGLATANSAYIAPPSLGVNVFTLLENVASGSSLTWEGTEAGSAIYAWWRG